MPMPASRRAPSLRDPEHYAYDLNLPDIAGVWRRGRDRTQFPAAAEMALTRLRVIPQDISMHGLGGDGSRRSYISPKENQAIEEGQADDWLD